MILLVNLKNESTKKDLCFAYAQSKYSAYPENEDKIARLLLLQYAYKRTKQLQQQSSQQKGDKNGRKMTLPNQKIRTIIIQVLQVSMLEKRHQVKIRQVLLAAD